MGSTSEIMIRFQKERHARWAMHVAQDMIKLIYAPRELPWVQAAAGVPSLSKRYLAYRQQADALKLNPRGCALEWLSRRGTRLVIERCQDIVGWTGVECEEDYFPQLCYAIALRFPQVSFAARFRYEMTVSGAIQLICMDYDGAVMHVRELSGERPMDEDDWSRALVYDYAAEDGVFLLKRTVDPTGEIKEVRNRETLRCLRLLQRRCRPLLVGLSDDTVFGLDTPRPVPALRGIFLNPKAELLGLDPEREELRLDDRTDVLLCGLRGAMQRLLNCDPDALLLLGLPREHILFCSEEGEMILDHALFFLSQRAIFSFSHAATQLLHEIQRMIAEKRDAKTIGRKMMHLIRLYAMGGELLADGRVTAYREEHALLSHILEGKYQDPQGRPTGDYENVVENYRGAFNAAALRTHLPLEPDQDRINALTIEIAGRAV